MKRVIGLGHIARVGKDEAAAHLVNTYGFTRLSTADMIREFLMELNPIVQHSVSQIGSVKVETITYREAIGWLTPEIAKDEVKEVRRLQQEVGQIMRRLYGDDFWVERLAEKIEETEGDVVIPDVRFPNEAYMIVQADGYVARVDRPGYEPLDHITDQALVDFPDFDFVIDNDGDIDQLHSRVDDMLDIISFGDVRGTINVAEWTEESVTS